MKINISHENQNKLKEFINSNSFSNRSMSAYSDYWEEHASRMRLEFFNDAVDISGESGFYLSEAASKRFFRRLIKAIKSPRIAAGRVFALCRQYFSTPRYMTWADGFNATMRHDPVTDPDMSPFRINHLNLSRDFNDTLANIQDVKKDFAQWTTLTLSDHVLIAYYFRNILIPHVDKNKKNLNILEIGGGGGNLASILYRHLSPKIFFMVDLPESIVNAYVYLSDIFPKAAIVLPNEFENYIGLLDFNNAVADSCGTFVFLTPWQINLLPHGIMDLTINTHSFQEMTHAQINDYFCLVESASKHNGLFFCVNRVEKIPCKGNAYVEIQNAPPNRFYEYPWRTKNLRLIDEVSRLHRVCAADNTAIRLERIVKSL